MDTLFSCMACSKGFSTQTELLEHLEEHTIAPPKQTQSNDGGSGTTDGVHTGRHTEEAANAEALPMDCETPQSVKLFKSRPLVQGTGSSVADDASAKKEKVAVAINKHKKQPPRVEPDKAQRTIKKTLNPLVTTYSNRQAMDPDILMVKPEPPEDSGSAHRAFREVWVKLYECTICCTPFPDKESCESHFEAHLTQPLLHPPQPDIQLPQHGPKSKKPRLLIINKSNKEYDEFILPSSTKSGAHARIKVKAKPEKQVSIKPGRKYLCYVCYEEFTDKDACNLHIEEHTQTIRQPPKQATTGTSQSSTKPNTATATDPTVSSKVENHSEIPGTTLPGISDSEDEGDSPDAEDSSSCGDDDDDKSKDLSSTETKTGPSILDREHDYTIPPPPLHYQCHVCKRGYSDKDACVKHVLTHVREPLETHEETSDADNHGDHTKQEDSNSPPPQGRIVSVALEKVTKSTEECDDGGPRNQYVVSFHEESPENSPEDQLSTLFQCQICLSKFSDRSSCQTHVKTHAKQPTQDTNGASANPVDTTKALVLRDILPVPEEQHTFSMDSAATAYQCHLCKVKFSDQVSCESHIVGHLKEPVGGIGEQNEGAGDQPSPGLKCTVCHYWFVGKETFKEHSATHPTCKACGARFTTDARLRQHYGLVHPRYDKICKEEDDVTGEPTTDGEEGVEQVLGDGSGEEWGQVEVKHEIDDNAGEPEESTDGLKCRVCQQQFLSRELFTDHIVTHPQCEKCHKRFTTNRELRKHNTAVHPNYRRACELCRRVFKRKASYKRHVLLHDAPLPVVCHICGEKFTTNNKLRNHNKEVHVIKEPIVCELCGKVYKSRRSYNMHMSQHTAPPKPIPDCGVCAQGGFDSVEDLAKHMVGHGLTQPLICVICSQQYQNPANFIGHMKEHANQPEQCLVCKETFPTYKEYKTHAATHGQAKSECKDCGKTFSTPRNLVIHIKLLHTKDHQFKCEECGEGFVSKHKLRRHMQRHSGIKPYKCDYCDHTSGYKWDLQKHMGQHTGSRAHMCHQCGKTYPARAYLTHHIRTSCKAGPKTTNAKPRVSRAKPKPKITPTEHGTFPCVICLDAFTTSGALTRHIKRQHPDEVQTAVKTLSVEDTPVEHHDTIATITELPQYSVHSL